MGSRLEVYKVRQKERLSGDWYLKPPVLTYHPGKEENRDLA